MTGANGMHSTACGHPKADDKSPATTVKARKWSVQLVEFGFPTRNGRKVSWRGAVAKEEEPGPS